MRGPGPSLGKRLADVFHLASEGLVRLPEGHGYPEHGFDSLDRQSPVWAEAMQYDGGQGEKEFSQGLAAPPNGA